MTDSHAHLDACAEPAAVLVERARQVGVRRIVTIGTGVASARASLAIAEGEDGVVAALGVDPHRASSGDADRLDELRRLLDHPRAVAVGETGLDNHHRFATPAEQLQAFDAQIDLAADLGLPLVIHCRDAARETAAALARFDGTVVLHCFSEPELLPVALHRGYYVSFAGNVTFPRSDELRAAAAAVPDDRLLAETDSPYLAPQGLRGRPNEPANVVRTLAVLADVRGVEPDELESAIDANAVSAFGLDGP